MDKVQIINNGVEISIAQLEMLLSKQQLVLGNSERDLILRTAGNIKIQVGNKFYDLPLSNSESTVTPTTNTIIVGSVDSMPYPGDGIFVYGLDLGILYLTVESEFRDITKQKEEVVEVIKDAYLTFSEASNYFVSNKDNLFVGDHSITNQTNISLHVESDSNKYGLGTDKTEQFKGLFVGSKDLKHGVAIYDTNGADSYITSQGKSFKFLTNGAEQPFNPLNLYEDSVGINTNPLSGNALSVKGKTYLDGRVVTSAGMQSDMFSTGATGNGFSIYYEDGKWCLEIDSVKERNSTEYSSDVNSVKGLNGSQVFDFSLIVRNANLYETIDLYANASVIGKYKTQNKDLAPRGSRVKVVRTAIDDLPDINVTSVKPNQKYQILELAYGAGDLDDQLKPLVGPTYIRDNEGRFKTIKGSHSYDQFSNSFVQSTNGSLASNGTIYVYSINTDSQVEVGDLFYYKRWNKNKSVTTSTVKLVEVIKKFEDSFYVYSYDNLLEEGDSLVKIGNVNYDIDVIEINTGDSKQGYLQGFRGIRSFNELIPIYYKDEIGDGTPTHPEDILIVDPIIPFNKVVYKHGILEGLKDEDVFLDSNKTHGLYSNNVYLKGNFSANTMKMGDEFLYKDKKLTIKDLETVKNREVKGVGPLEGGGKIFDKDLEIKHKVSYWEKKSDLPGSTVIANLNVDEYGHLIGWTTKNLEGGVVIDDDGVILGSGTEVIDGVMHFIVNGVSLMKLDTSGLYLRTGLKTYSDSFN